MNINNQDIPEEELNFTSLSIDDIVKQNTDIGSDTEDVQQDTLHFEPSVTPSANSDTDPGDLQPDAEEVDVQSETQDETQSETQNATESKYEDSVYSAALDLVRESNLLLLPDELGNVTPEVWDDILAENKRIQYENALNEVKSRAGDEYAAELFDYVYNGASFEEIQAMKSTLQSEINIDDLDTRNEEHQRYLIEEFLKDGLDPNNAAHNIRLTKIDDEVEGYFDRLEADEIADKAKDFFLEKYEDQRAYLYEKQQQDAYLAQQQQQQKEQEKEYWISDFRNTLESRKWSRDKKDAVVRQFDVVELDNGQQMELWKYKWDNMWKKPDMVQVFMDFLSDIDPYTMEFQNKTSTVNKQVSNKIQELINRKSQQRSSGKYVSHKRTTEQNTPKTIDPRKLI